MKNKASSTFKVGAVSLSFLIIGYQTALFVQRAAVLRIESVRDRPDTVYVIDDSLAIRLLSEERIPAAYGSGNHFPGGPSSDKVPEGVTVIRRDAPHPAAAAQVRGMARRTESFRFDPNTVGISDLQRLGFSEKQAQAIANYRDKGGRFRRKEDFARSFVVADSVYERLEPFIDIPLTDINAADSAAFDALPGIGPYFAAKMVSYREELHGYSFPEQFLDIWNFGQERYDALADLITCSAPEPYPLWSLPAEELRKHPYIRTLQAARAIVLYRDNNPPEALTAEGLGKAGILPPEDAGKLARCRILSAPE